MAIADAYDSGAFSITTYDADHAGRVLPCALEVVGNQIVAVAPEGRLKNQIPPRIYVGTLPLGTDFETQVKIPSNWGWTLFQPKINPRGDSTDSSGVYSLSPMGGALSGSGMVVVWAQADFQSAVVGWRLLASTMGTSGWNDAIQLQDTNGSALQSSSFSGASSNFTCGELAKDGDARNWYSPAVCVRAFDQNSFIVGISWPDGGQIRQGKDRHRFYLFNILDCNVSAGTLKARGGSSYIIKEQQSAANSFINFDWFPVGDTTYIVDQTFDQNACTSSPASFNVLQASLFTSAAVGTAVPDTLAVSPVVGGMGTGNVAFGGCVRRTFFNGLICWYRDTGSGLAAAAISTTVAPSNSTAWGTETDGSLRLSPGFDGNFLLGGCAVVDYVATQQSVAGLNVTKTMPDRTTSQQAASVAPVYRIVLGNGPYLTGRVFKIGWLASVTGASLGPPAPSAGTTAKLILKGIIDGPLPTPLPNVQNMAANRDINDVHMGEVYYGSSAETNLSWQDSTTTSIGFSSSLTTTANVGPDLSLSMAWGTSNAWGGGTANTVESCSPLSTQWEFPAAGTDQPPTVAPWGLVFGTTVNFSVDQFWPVVVDRSNSGGWIPDPAQNNAFISIGRAAFSDQDAGGGEFYPFSVDPGSLDSYQASAIDQRMAQFYQAHGLKLPPDKNGTPYGSYTAMMDALAFPLSTDPGTPYLTFRWQDGSSTNTSSTTTTTTFTEHSWTYNEDLSVGISGGLSISVSGDIVSAEIAGFQFSMLCNQSYSAVHSTQSGTSSSWTVGTGGLPGLNEDSLKYSGSPPAGLVRGYTVRIYLLPPNQLWTQELQAGIGSRPVPAEYNSIDLLQAEAIDPNSAPWKLMFMVENIAPA